MKPLVSIIMGSTSDLPVMEKACKLLDEFQVPFEVHALSAHRTPNEVTICCYELLYRGIKVIIAGAGMAAPLPGGCSLGHLFPSLVCLSNGRLEGLDAMLSIIRCLRASLWPPSA